MLLFCPFPCVGLASYIVYRLISEIIEKKQFNCIISFQNIVSLPIALIALLFFKTNKSANNISILGFSKSIVLNFVLFLVCEFLVYLVLLYGYNKKDIGLKVLFITVCVLSFVVMGSSYDFSWRICIPLSFYIMILVVKALYFDKISKKIKIALIIVYCIGAITPATEMIRTTHEEYCIITNISKEPERSSDLASIFDKENNVCYNNFTGSTNSFFYKYFAKG